MNVIQTFNVFNMAKHSKKGRLNSSARQDINRRAVASVMDNDTDEDCHFGRVLRHLGAGNIRVMLSNKTEGIARIRPVLSRRGSTPIVSGDIVILSGREFETKAVEVGMRFDVIAVMSRHDASKLEKTGRIPAWMLTEETQEGKEDIFDYTEDKEFADSRSDSGSDVDVDRI